MAQLLETLAQGTYYDDALTEVLGVDTEGLEREWQENLERPEKAPQPSLCPGVFGVGLLFWPLLKKGWTPS